jgi:hypothetical protein
MAIDLNRQHYSYYFFLIISCYLFQFTTADNVTDYHSNETIVEFNSTFVSLTTIANISDKEVSFDNNASTLINDVSTSVTFVNSTLLSTSVPLKTTDVNVSESNTTFLNKETDLTTILTQISSTEKNEEEATTVSMTSCEISKYGCCADGFTEQTGKSLKKELFLIYIYILSLLRSK